MSTLILLRHGESQWNLENRFTGWVDVDLSDRGRDEAVAAGTLLRGMQVDVVYTSVLKRAINTATLACEAAGLQAIPVVRDEALNERHYGDLQGLNKQETAEKFGAAQVQIWRRSYDVPPPNGESLKDTAARVLPYFDAHILPDLLAGKNVLIVAHGNSLRALIMKLDRMSEAEIVELNIATGAPIVYTLTADGVVIGKRML